VEEERAFMAEALELNPRFSLDWYRKMSLYKDQAHTHRILDAYRKAGLKNIYVSVKNGLSNEQVIFVFMHDFIGLWGHGNSKSNSN